MARARKRKNTSFRTQMVKCVFLYGKPNKEKTTRLTAIQTAFTDLVNTCIEGLSKETGITEYLVKNDSRSSKICELKKQLRPEKVNTAYCQNAFDMAFVQLSNRLLNIKQDMYAACPPLRWRDDSVNLRSLSPDVSRVPNSHALVQLLMHRRATDCSGADGL